MGKLRGELKGRGAVRGSEVLPRGADGWNSAAHLIRCSNVAVHAALPSSPDSGSQRYCHFRGYDLDVSLFERLMTRWGQAGQQAHDGAAAPGQQQADGGSAAPGHALGAPGVPLAVLARQRRMRPSIAALLRPVYPHLEDHPCVQVGRLGLGGRAQKGGGRESRRP